MNPVYSTYEAKARFSEVLRLVREGTGFVTLDRQQAEVASALGFRNGGALPPQKSSQ